MSVSDTERAARATNGNRFALASLVRKRADEIVLGAPVRVVTAGGKPVTVAIAEVARGETWIKGRAGSRVAIGRRGDDAVIVCKQCDVLVRIRRKPDVVPQGRPPTRCAAHGLSDNWIQVGEVRAQKRCAG